MRHHRKQALLTERAIELRGKATWSEQLLWERLRGCRLGVRFRRQVVVGNRYIADFVAPAARVIVEVDGGWHRGRERADARREKVLRRLGYRVVRVEAELVERDLEAAVGRVWEVVKEARSG